MEYYKILAINNLKEILCKLSEVYRNSGKNLSSYRNTPTITDYSFVINQVFRH